MDRRSWLNSHVLIRGQLLLGLCLCVVLLDSCETSGGRRRTVRREAPKVQAPAAQAPAVQAPAAQPAAPVREEPKAQRRQRQPRLGGVARDARSQEILDRLGSELEGGGLEVEALIGEAEQDLLNFEPLRAQAKLELALEREPGNTKVQRLVARVQAMVGDKRGEIAQVRDSLVAQGRAQDQQARAEVNILLNDGRRLEDSGEFGRAVEKYEAAIDLINNFPFNLDLASRLQFAKDRYATAKRRAEDEEIDDRRAREVRIEEDSRDKRHQNLVLEQARVEELRMKAREAYKRADYDIAIANAERLLEGYPGDLEAKALKARALKDIQLAVQNENFVTNLENYREALVEIEESSIVYQKIFRYPPRKEWERLAHKTLDLQARLDEDETEVEREIKRKLEVPQTVGFADETPFAAVIATLRGLSGVNIILNKAAREATADVNVQLPQVRDLPLRNVLRLVLNQGGEANLDYAIREGALIIGTRETLTSKMILHFYDINDITQKHPNFAAPDLALDETEGQGDGGGAFFDDGAGGEEVSGDVETDKLVELIERELNDASGEVVGSARIQRGKLAVRTTFEFHLKVQKLLEEFRKATGIMITVESRFLTLQDNFLEEIGVNMGSANNTFLQNSIPDIDGAGTSLAPGYEFLSAQQDVNMRSSTIGQFSEPLGSRVNPFNLTNDGGGAYQLNVLTEAYQLEAVLSGVHKTQEIRDLSSPRVTAHNGQTAHTMVVEQAAYIKDLEVNQTGIIPVINPVIGVLNTGSILEVRPNVSHDRKYIILELQPTLAEFLDSDIALLNLSGNFTQVPVELPVTSVTKIKTTITVPDGGTVMLGGLKRKVEGQASIGIPGLRRVPILNIIFGRKGDSILRSNLFVLINAKITIVQEEEARLFNI